ncbi:hypothetical protein HYV50_01045 [Candidatus Pacearchaeota archaeon]|nr:hypothetical protein [Candidatus Pacearchaeota archaeon]
MGIETMIIDESCTSDLIKRLEKVRRGKLSFKTKNLVIKGREISVSVPGRSLYNDIMKAEVEYTKPMYIKVNGLLVKIPPKSIGIDEGEVHVIGYRRNKTEEAFDRKDSDIVFARVLDPELTLYTQNNKIVLNQVIGMPIIFVRTGVINYK